MKVSELIDQLRDCGRPDAEIRLIVRNEPPDGRHRRQYHHATIDLVYSAALIENTVIIAGLEGS